MAERFTISWAEEAVAALRAGGVEFADGLTPEDFDRITDAFGVATPPELERLLTVGVPVSPKWARWAEGADLVAEESRSWIDRAFTFDIVNDQYWHSLFGERPTDNADAIETALTFVHSAPPLFPIYGHRFLATSPADGSRAVLSVWQAVDSIVYGNDLADYLGREFGIARPTWSATTKPQVPIWERLLDLYGSEDTR